MVYHPILRFATLGVFLLLTLPVGASLPTPIYYSTETYATGIATGDFNGDGLEDLAIVYTLLDAVHLHLGRGDGLLDDPIVTSTPFGVSPGGTMRAGDMNGDGDLDLVIGSFDFLVLLGDGRGSFSVELFAGDSVQGMVLEDFNSDGKIDVAAVGGNVMFVMLNQSRNRKLKLSSPVFYPYTARGLAAGDFNDDGTFDLVAPADSGNRFFLLVGDGDGAFQPPEYFAGVDVPLSISVGDFDRDGHDDVAIPGQTPESNDDDPIYVLLGDGAGGFGAPSEFIAGASAREIQVADFDGDGVLDLVAVNNGSKHLSFLAGNGDGTFDTQVRSPAWKNGFELEAADFDQDGTLDVVHAGARAIIHRGAGDGRFGIFQANVGDYPMALAHGDFNEDGVVDFAAGLLPLQGWGGDPNDLSILIGLGNGDFEPEQILTAVWGGGPPVVADYDGDNHLDVAMGRGVGSVHLGRGDGSFDLPVEYDVPFGTTVHASGDFNEDGFDDLVGLTTDVVSLPGLSLFMATGDGQIADRVLVPTGSIPRSVAVADVDGDAHLDLVAANGDSDDLSILLGRGDGTFTVRPPVYVGADAEPFDVEIVDMDLDGRLDVVVSKFGLSEVDILLGDGLGGFAQGLTLATRSEPQYLAVGDFSGDGHPDVAVGDFGGTYEHSGVSVFRSDGKGGFEPATLHLAGLQNRVSDLTAVDVDGNGSTDLVSLDSGSIFVLLNSTANAPPVADAGPDQLVAATSTSGATVSLDGSASSDPDSSPGTNDDIVFFEWFEDFGTSIARSLGTGDRIEPMLSVGAHAITLRVKDSKGSYGTDDVYVVVVETMVPGLHIELSPDRLWPPNHRMLAIHATVICVDSCVTESALLESVASNEPDNAVGSGDGNTIDDIQLAETGTADFDFLLRAERDGSGSGRIYTVTYSADDGTGTRVLGSAQIAVPLREGGVTDPLTLTVEESATGTVVRWLPVAGAVTYDVVRGTVSRIGATPGAYLLGPVVCIAGGTTGTSTEGFEDNAVPPSGTAFFYLAQYDDRLDVGYGTESADMPRIADTGDCDP